MASCEIDYLVFSAHKMYAPFGSGALVARKGILALEPKERELLEASGNENAAGIAAMGKGFILLQRIGTDVIQDEEQSLTAHALDQLSQVRGIRVFGISSPTSACFSQKGGVIPFLFDKPMPKQLAQKLSENAGIGVRYGCHCEELTA